MFCHVFSLGLKMRLKAYQNQRSFVPVVLLVVNFKRYGCVRCLIIHSQLASQRNLCCYPSILEPYL